MQKKTHIKVGTAIVLITIAAYVLKMVQGWEIVILGLLLTLGFYFHLNFINYVDLQKKEGSNMSLSDSNLHENTDL